MRRLAIAAMTLALTVAAACGKEQGSAPKPQGEPPRPAPAPAPAGLDKLAVTIDGKQVVMTKAFIKSIPVDGRYQIYVTSQSGSCAELMDNLFNRRHDEDVLLFDVGQRLAPDGTLAGVVTDVYIRGTGEVLPGAKASVRGSADKGGKAEVALDFAATGEQRKYEVHGTLVAEGCGARPMDTDGVPKAKHASSASVTLAGKKLPLASAIRTGNKDDRWVFLSTGPKDCSGTWPWAALKLERKGRFWRANGLWLALEQSNDSMADVNGQPETRELKIVTGATGTSEDGPTIEIELSGSGTIGGYPVTLEGKIEAIDCPS